MRLKTFIFRAGKVIVPICILMGILHAFSWSGAINHGGSDFQSILSSIGRFLTPIFAPMGIEQDNWPATVGLMGGVLAKEVVVGTLNTLYTQLGHLNVAADTFHFWQKIYEALASIPANLSQLSQAAAYPLFSKTPIQTVNPKVYGVMYQYFNGPIGAFSYLLFVLLYFPCVSTTAAMLRELDARWAVFSVLWMSAVAYGAAVIFYQIATWSSHWQTSSAWIVGIVAFFALVIGGIRLLAVSEKPHRHSNDKAVFAGARQ